VQETRTGGRAGGDGPSEESMNGYDELSAEELLAVIASMDGEALARLREYEAAHGARAAVLEALDRRLARPR
jgi:hypothetical protein